MPRALVTGANGHLGANLVRALLARDYEVVPFVRKTSDLRGLEKLNLKYAYGDVMDAESVMSAAAGCDVIFHCAAVFSFRKTLEEMMVPAVTGAENVLRAAARHGTKRVIYTSSIMAVGPTQDPSRPRNETDWNTGTRLPYSQAKVHSERHAHAVAQDLNVPLITLCPASVWGPYDYRITPSTKALVDYLNGDGITGLGGYNYVAASDVASAHISAFEKGTPGERYVVGGANISLRDLATITKKLTGNRNRDLPIPRWAMLPIISLNNSASRLFNLKPIISNEEIYEFGGQYGYLDCSKIADAFDYEPQPIETVVEESARWLAHIGALKPATTARIQSSFPPLTEWK